MVLSFALWLAVVAIGASETRGGKSENALGHIVVTGRILSNVGMPVPGALVQAGVMTVNSDVDGMFRIILGPQASKVFVSASGFLPQQVYLVTDTDSEIEIQLDPAPETTVTVTAQPEVSDASGRTFDSSELPTKIPGPGAPVTVPGLPVMTASGGVKAPQYFAPGVAGDHGEPIAQYVEVGDFLFPNNLPANAHGNGFADPNLLISTQVASVTVDGGAFDVRHGNNAVDVATAYRLQPQVSNFLGLSGDSRNFDITSGLSLRDGWVSLETNFGDGYLRRPEERKQFKLNGEQVFNFGHHTLTLFGAGYYGSSRVPGLVPIDLNLPDETIDPRQSDRTQTELLVASDRWQLSQARHVNLAGYFRTYGLNLLSNFGDGLIRQSEFRTVAGGNASYAQTIGRWISLDAGVDLRRDAPTNSQLEHLDATGNFTPVTRDDLIISDVGLYATVNGTFGRFISFSAGVRHDQVNFTDTSNLPPFYSLHSSDGVTSPKGSLTLHANRQAWLPIVTLQYGEGFHTNDPRIVGVGPRSTVAVSRAYQLTATEYVKGAEVRVALARVSNSQELAKIDADTGLTEDLGPSLVRSLTVSARRKFRGGTIQGSFARATAKERLRGMDVPEAPRLIWDLYGTTDRLPMKLRVSAGFSYVGERPLGDGFVAVPVHELSGSLERSLHDGRITVGGQFVIGGGFTGQTLQQDSAGIEQIVGVRNASRVGATVRFNLARR